MRTKHDSPRGYLMIDIMVGGALAAVVIAGLLTVLASARQKNVAATRDIIATQLVVEKLEQQRAAGFTALTVGTATEPEVAGQTGKYQRVTVITAGSENVGTGVDTFTLAFKDVAVTVTYETVDGQRKTQAASRVYE